MKYNNYWILLFTNNSDQISNFVIFTIFILAFEVLLKFFR